MTTYPLSMSFLLTRDPFEHQVREAPRILCVYLATNLTLECAMFVLMLRRFDLVPLTCTVAPLSEYQCWWLWLRFSACCICNIKEIWFDFFLLFLLVLLLIVMICNKICWRPSSYVWSFECLGRRYTQAKCPHSWQCLHLPFLCGPYTSTRSQGFYALVEISPYPSLWSHPQLFVCCEKFSIISGSPWSLGQPF